MAFGVVRVPFCMACAVLHGLAWFPGPFAVCRAVLRGVVRGARRGLAWRGALTDTETRH